MEIVITILVCLLIVVVVGIVILRGKGTTFHELSGPDWFLILKNQKINISMSNSTAKMTTLKPGVYSTHEYHNINPVGRKKEELRIKLEKRLGINQ